MTQTSRTAFTRLAVAFSLGAAVGACSTIGGDAHIIVSAETTGTNIDPNGYALFIDTIGPRSLPVNGQVDVVVNPGDHIVLVNDVASNCRGAADTTQQNNFKAGVSLISGNTVRMTLEIECK